MELPSTETVVLLLAFAFVIAMIRIGIRMVKLGAKQEEKRRNARAEIEQNAAAHGRRFIRTGGDDTWRQTGASPKGVAWELTYSIATKTEYGDEDRDSAEVPDTISGQLFEWHAAALRRPARAFRFGQDKGKGEAGKRILDDEERLWQRWQLEVDDAVLTRRAFTPAVCDALAMLPAEKARNTYQDRRTSIMLGTEGLVATLGVYKPGPEVVELWIGICESMADAIVP